MSTIRKSTNVEIGKRLREARHKLRGKQTEFACALDVTEEHYRKYESGATGLSAEKLLILFEKYGIDPTYLVTGKNSDEFNLDRYISSCNKEQRDQFIDRVLAYMNRLLKDMR